MILFCNWPSKGPAAGEWLFMKGGSPGTVPSEPPPSSSLAALVAALLFLPLQLLLPGGSVVVPVVVVRKRRRRWRRPVLPDILLRSTLDLISLAHGSLL